MAEQEHGTMKICFGEWKRKFVCIKTANGKHIHVYEDGEIL